MKEKGQSLFEVVMALAVISLIIGGVVLLTSFSIRNSLFASNNSKANRFLQEASEWLRGERDESWSLFLLNIAGPPSPTVCSCTGAPSTCVCCLNTTPLTQSSAWNGGVCTSTEVVDSIFTRQVTFSCYANQGSGQVSCSTADPTLDTIQAELTVSWVDGQGTHTVRSFSQLTDWRSQ